MTEVFRYTHHTSQFFSNYVLLSGSWRDNVIISGPCIAIAYYLLSLFLWEILDYRYLDYNYYYFKRLSAISIAGHQMWNCGNVHVICFKEYLYKPLKSLVELLKK